MSDFTDYTDFSMVCLPPRETAMSRRYLRLLEAWLPVAMRYFNDWPDRPNCGHFFGGVYWYGLETAMPIVAVAAAGTSEEFDEKHAGLSRDALRRTALKGLRYLCFTHDTGPADCLRPRESWGRPQPAGTKWGERGAGFFPESQCGVTIAFMAMTAAMIRDLLGREEHAMLSAIAVDYLQRFAEMDPRSGVYADTQTEENAWTGMGLAASLVLAPRHPKAPQWWDNAKRWLFCATTRPDDMQDARPFADGKTVRELCSMTFTTLPDGTAENHGFVHPGYMASPISMTGETICLMRLFGQEPPPHMFSGAGGTPTTS